MPRSYLKGVTSGNQAKPFIPNIYIQISENASIGSAYCRKDKIHWFYLIRKKRGFSDFEEVRCSCCEGKLFRGKGLPSGFSTGESLEVIAWLEEHPTKNKILILVDTKSSSEMLENVLQSLMRKLATSNKYLKIENMMFGAALSRLKHGKRKIKENNSLSRRKKRLSMLSYLKSMQIPKIKKQRQGKGTQVLNDLKERVTRPQKLKSKNLTKFSESAKKVLKKFNGNFQEKSKPFKRFLREQKKLSTHNLERLSDKDLDNLKIPSYRKSKSVNKFPSLYLRPLTHSLLCRLEAAGLLKTEKGGIGQIDRKTWVLIVKGVLYGM